MYSAGSMQWSMRVFELATCHGRGDLDDGPSKSAADAAETGNWGCQVDNQEMGEVAASWEAERGSITGVLSRPLLLKVKLVTCFKTSEVNPEVITRRMKNGEMEEASVRSSYNS